MSTITVLAAYELFDNKNGEPLNPVGTLARNVCKFLVPAPPAGIEHRDYAEIAARANIMRIACKRYPRRDVRYYMSGFTFALNDPFAGDASITPWPQCVVARKMQELLFNPSPAWVDALRVIQQAMMEEEQRSEQAQTAAQQTR
ncbi:hypothetical protein [Burkholderia phage FLC9]|nr:hypothetical protein [Burkholderia phage FLC9]